MDRDRRMPGVEMVLGKIRDRMEREAARCEMQANKPGQFLSLADAYAADARNYRAMIKEIDAVLPRKRKARS